MRTRSKTGSRTCFLTCPNISLILYGMDEVRDEVEVKVKVKDEVEVKDVEVKDEAKDTR